MSRRRPLVALVSVVVAMSIVQAAYVAAGYSFNATLSMLLTWGFSLAFVVWMELDARSRGILPCHDFGFLSLFVFPASLAWYVFWSRGWRGVFLLAGLLGLMFLPWISSVATWILVYGRG